MVFSTLTFLFFFFPTVLVSYYLFPNRLYRNLVLLAFSVGFYGWGEPKYILLMILATLIAYLGGLVISAFDAQEKQGAKRAAMVVSVIAILLNLFVFKYLNFFADTLNFFVPGLVTVKKIALPIGISFYTFQILSYVLDLYWKKIDVQKNFLYLLLYVSFFPQLIAGPIVRYQTVEIEIQNRRESLDEVIGGLRRFIIGLAKKVILANNAGMFAETVYFGDPEKFGSAMYWFAAIAYALQIYFDFSGYSDMAIGLGKMFGFHFLENFNYPYIATSVTDFWRRWHISLSTWFRDYVYIPLGGNRVKKGRWLFNICVVWMLTGLWHGAAWNFVFWGSYYALLLILEKVFLLERLEKLPKLLRWGYTMFAVLIGWVIFNVTDVGQLSTVLVKMFSFQKTDLLEAIKAGSSIIYGVLFIPLGVLCMFPWMKKIHMTPNAVSEAVINIGCLLLLVISICFIMGSTYNPFIYFRF